MKKTSQRLQTVLKLAKLKEQQAAEQLAQAIRHAEAQHQQAQQLHSYQQEYNTQFQLTVKGQVNAGQLQNYLRFFVDLDSASQGQQERVVLAENQREVAQLGWQQQYSRYKNMQKLISKKQQQEQKFEDAAVQREQDDRQPRTE